MFLKHGAFFCILTFGISAWTQDLSKMPVENFHVVTQDKMFRGARPTAAGVDALVKLGVKTDLDLEESDLAKKENALVNGRMKFLSVPMTGMDPATKEDAQKIISIITDPNNYPIYVHCLRGIDRTGFAVSLFRVSEGWTDTKAIAEWNTFRDAESEKYAHTYYEWGRQQISAYYKKLFPVPK
jgi:tyrosine-protein phosphatase SIW14